MTKTNNLIRSHLANFVKNRQDSSGNRYWHERSLSCRLATTHHFMRLVNVLLPNEMPHAKTGTLDGVTKIKPNFISLKDIDGRVDGCVWLNTKHESDCVRDRLVILNLWGIKTKCVYSTNSSNHIVNFVLNTANGVEDEQTDEKMKTPAISMEVALHIVRQEIMNAHEQIESIDEQIKTLNAKKVDLLDKVKTIKANIGV